MLCLGGSRELLRACWSFYEHLMARSLHLLVVSKTRLWLGNKCSGYKQCFSLQGCDAILLSSTYASNKECNIDHLARAL